MPFSKMTRGVQKAIDTEAKKGGKTKYKGRRQWLAIYHSARSQGKSKSQAAAIAGGGVKKESFSLMEIYPVRQMTGGTSKKIFYKDIVPALDAAWEMWRKDMPEVNKILETDGEISEGDFAGATKPFQNALVNHGYHPAYATNLIKGILDDAKKRASQRNFHQDVNPYAQKIQNDKSTVDLSNAEDFLVDFWGVHKNEVHRLLKTLFEQHDQDSQNLNEDFVKHGYKEKYGSFPNWTLKDLYNNIKSSISESILPFFESHVIDNGISPEEGKNIVKKIHMDPHIPFDQFLVGANHEIEHKKEVDNSPIKIGEIAVDHLKEDPEYYQKLQKIEKVDESMSISSIFEGIIADSPVEWMEKAKSINSPGTIKIKSKKKKIDYSKIKNNSK